MEKAIRYGRSAIEDLAFTIRSSRESDGVRRLCCTRHDFAETLKMRADMGTEDKGEGMGVEVRSSQPPRRTAKEWR